MGAEQHLPYERPPLSKGYLLGAAELDDAFVHPSSWYADHDIELRLGTAVTAIDPGAHTVTAGQEPLVYSRLLIATGARPRRLGIADDSGAPVAYLRTIEDSQRLKAALEPGRRIVIVGGGWIGLEVAAAARTAGADVVVLEALAMPLVRVLGPEVAEVFGDLHREHGVEVRTAVSVTGVAPDGDRAVVTLADGSSLTADLLVVGVGVAPNTELAEAAGLETDNGVLVDERLRASDPDVFAAGDVANAYHPALGRRVRVEHWDTAIEHGRTAARNMLGAAEAYTRLPYFFTDQYDLGIEYVGSIGPDGYDEVVLRGDVAGRRFTAFWVNGDRVVAGMHANDRDAIEPVRRIVTAGRVDLGRLRDSRSPLDEIA
ncbi:pyridine nucleotide-disulfide oxidoreductase [Cellulomonas sp. NTE-D12]|nr:pyridine nucleotide-disulfide oxidoreductase [Cellulomonas sp. NTE-D12]